MSYTMKVPVVQSAWAELASDVSTVFIQLQDDGPVYIQVSQTPPDIEDYSGVELDRRGLMEVTLDGLEVGDAVYARCRHDETNDVVVVAPGTASAGGPRG